MNNVKKQNPRKDSKYNLFNPLTPPMLRLCSSEVQGCKIFKKPYKPFHVGIDWIALAECYQISTMCQGFSHF